MKRFRYKGDLSKHIKRYHPGHTQPLTPVPLQEDELRSAFTAKHIYQTSSSSSGISSNSSTSSRSSTSSVSSAAAASTTQAVVTTAAATVAPTIHIQHPQQVIAVEATAGSGGGAVVAAASSQQQGDNKFFLPLLPQHPLRPTELVSPQHQHKQSESKVILATSADGDGRLIPVQISSSPGGQKHITLAKGSFAAAGSSHLSRSIQIVKGGGAVYTNHTSR